MGIPVDKLASALKAGAATRLESDESVRVAVIVDATASPAHLAALKAALVPQATSGLVRVSRLDDAVEVKPDTDVVVIVSGGSAGLEACAQRAVVAGAPTVVVAESAVEVPFIKADTPMLGLICATDEHRMLSALAAWILERTDKPMAFAANFAFMREAASRRVVAAAARTNAVTGALVFIPGADFPVMAATQLGMMGQLASIHGKPLRPERAYEAAGVLASGLLARAAVRRLAPSLGRAGFIAKALAGGAGTYAMGLALTALYERDIDYGPVNDALAGAVSRVRGAFARDRVPAEVVG